MTKLLFTAAVVLALSSDAGAAASLSNNLTGEYCNGSADGDSYTYCAPGDWEKRTDDWLILEPKRLLGHEVECRFTSVREKLVPVKLADNISIGASTAKVVAKCGGEGCVWRVRMTFEMYRGILTVKTRPIGKEVCRG